MIVGGLRRWSAGTFGIPVYYWTGAITRGFGHGNIVSFKSLKVWRALKRCPGSRRRNLAMLINMPVLEVKSALRFLGETGCAEFIGRGSDCRWTALDREPIDTRGTAANSLANLKYQAGRWARVVYRRPLMKPNRPPPKVQPATELERCWPILGVIRQID